MRGFTLVEVLVAMTLLAVTLSAAWTGIRRDTQNLQYTQDSLYAHWAALNAYNETVLQPGNTDDEREPTIETFLDRSYRVQIVQQDTDDTPPLRQVTVSVSADAEPDIELQRIEQTFVPAD